MSKISTVPTPSHTRRLEKKNCLITTFTCESQTTKLCRLQSSWLSKQLTKMTGLKGKQHHCDLFPAADTIPCLLTSWSDWSDCSVTCGKGRRTRQRTLKSPVELGECTEELEQEEKCMLPECRKYAGPSGCSITQPEGQEVRGKRQHQITLICSLQSLFRWDLLQSVMPDTRSPTEWLLSLIIIRDIR